MLSQPIFLFMYIFYFFFYEILCTFSHNHIIFIVKNDRKVNDMKIIRKQNNDMDIMVNFVSW